MQHIATTCLVGACLWLCADATAGVGVDRTERSNAPGVCQAARPDFTSGLRARPLALQNEGAGTAFVTCSIDGGDGPGGKMINLVEVELANATGSPLQVACTLVDGYGRSATYLSLSATVPGSGNGVATLVFDPSMLPEAPAWFLLPNLSCALPPGAAIHQLVHVYQWES